MPAKRRSDGADRTGGTSRRARTFALLIAAASIAAQPSVRDDGPIRADIRRVEHALPALADRAAALYVLARRYAQLGEIDRAHLLLSESLAAGEGFEPDEEPLRPLLKFADIRALADRFRAGHPAIHHARIAFSLPDPELFPEGIAWDPLKRLFYLGSEYEHKIIKVDAEHRASDFVAGGGNRLPPVGGVRVDPEDQSVWVATDSADFFHFDADGRRLARFTAPGPGPHILNDLVVRRGGDIFLTDTSAQVVFRVDRTTHAFTELAVHRPLMYPNGIALSPGERLLFVADLLGVVAIDLQTGLTSEVSPRSSTLAGIDGLYWYEGGLVGVQYGTGEHRVMRWRLSRDAQRVTSVEVLEYRTPLVSFPTTGAVAGDEFYFLANTGIGNLRDGRIVDRSKLEPVHVAVVKLR